MPNGVKTRAVANTARAWAPGGRGGSKMAGGGMGQGADMEATGITPKPTKKAIWGALAKTTQNANTAENFEILLRYFKNGPFAPGCATDSQLGGRQDPQKLAGLRPESAHYQYLESLADAAQIVETAEILKKSKKYFLNGRFGREFEKENPLAGRQDLKRLSNLKPPSAVIGAPHGT